LRFTLQRDLYRRLSACADGPSGRDVYCRVHVRVRLVPAGDTPEDRLALAAFRRAMPTDATGLRRERRTYFLHPSHGFLFETTHQAAPPIGEDAPVQARFGTATVGEVRTRLFGIGSGLRTPDHPVHPQIFHADQVEPSSKVGAGLLDPILAAVDGAGMQLGDRVPHPSAAIGSAPAASQPALQVLQPFLFGLRQARTREKFTGGQRSGDDHAAVDSDDFTCPWCRNRPRYRGERDMPTAHPVIDHPVRLRCGNRTGQSKSYPADLRHVDRSPLSAQFHHPAGLRAGDAEPLVLSGLSPGRPTVSAAVEVPASLVEIPQGLLLHGLRTCSQPFERRPRLRQLAGLFAVPRCGSPMIRPHRPLLDRQVPDVSGMPTTVLQRKMLRGSWVKPKAGHGTDPSSWNRQSLDSEGRESQIRSVEMSRSDRDEQGE
jgi:hypothetical protein